MPTAQECLETEEKRLRYFLYSEHGASEEGLNNVVTCYREALERVHTEEIVKKITSQGFWLDKHMAKSTAKQYVSVARAIAMRLLREGT